MTADSGASHEIAAESPMTSPVLQGAAAFNFPSVAS
jgi:hypothetical protein